MIDEFQMGRLAVPVSEQDHIQGPATAPVTLLEYGDYECPFCGQAYPIVKELQEQLSDQLRFVFRNFPLTRSHPHAENAAEAAEAAGAQGMFWPMHDTLYEHQQALDDPHLLLYAQELGLDLGAFEEAMIQHIYAERVREDLLGGVRSGVNGTPSFFINGIRHDGAFDFESLLTAIAARVPA